MHSTRQLLALGALILGLTAAVGAAEPVTTTHALAMYGDLKYGPDFKHFDYADPKAVKGGEVKLAGIGTFDSLNPFILKGVFPSGIGGLFATLTVQSDDEPFSEYGYVAQSMEVPADRSWVKFNLRKEARFRDASPITPADVVYSFNILKSKGGPFYRAYFASVSTAEQVGPHAVKFSFVQGRNRELPLIIGQLPVLSRAYWQGREFDKTTLEPPLGSGPYEIEAVDPGRSITYRRVPDYWADKLPVMVGRNNFERIRYDYYRDATVALEAFKAGEYDFRQELVAKDWATAYDVPAVREGLIKREEIRHQQPTGMQAFVYNTRREVFKDRRVREALAYAFDFEWTNRTLFNGAYTRTTSYFSNSELASRGLPGPGELKVLEPFKDRIPPAVLTREYQPPHSDGSGQIRNNLRKAMRLLLSAGWEVRDKRLVNKTTGKPMELEILLNNPSFERIVLPFVHNLKRLGITARVRTVDTTQYQNRLDGFDFDMVVGSFPESLSPGNEQRDFWGSRQADTPGSRNIAGVKDPVVDALVAEVISAPDRQSLIDRTRALDRVLLWGYYVIPQWHLQSFRVAYWDKFSRPKVTPKYALGLDTWWVDPQKAARLERLRGRPAD